LLSINPLKRNKSSNQAEWQTLLYVTAFRFGVAIFIFQLVAVSGFSQKSPNKAVDRGIPHSKQVLDSIVILNKQVLYFEKKGDSRNKILALLQCSNLYTKTNQLDQALIFSNSALMESQESNDDYGKMRSLIEMGNCYYNLNFKAEALESFLQAFQLSKELKITDATSYLIAQLGKVELELGSFVNAMDYAQQAIEYFTKKNNLEGQATAHMLLGSIHTKLGNFDLADSYLSKAIFLLQRLNSQALLSQAYVKFGQLRIAQKKNNEALSYLSQAAKIYEKDSCSNQNYAQVLRYYAVALSANGMKQEAISMANKSLAILKNTTNNLEIAKTWLIIGDIYANDSKLVAAHDAYSTVLNIATAGELKDEKRLAFKGLADILEKQGKPAEAYWFLKNYNKINDSILGLTQLSRVTQLENQLITLKKDKELEQKHLQVQQQDLELTHQSNRTTILIALLLLATGIIYHAYSLNKKKKEGQ